jgi:hypothetical protein
VTDYIGLYQQMHAAGPYGDSSIQVAPYLIPHIRQLRPRSVIDYGCGQSALPDLIEASGVPTVQRYDPAIATFSNRPTGPFDLLICIDVLEHVPEPMLDDVLTDMAQLARNAMLIIDTKPAKQYLPNGENAHCTVHPPGWWRERLAKHYSYLEPFVAKRDRARFKTWPTPLISHPLILYRTLLLRQQRRLAKKRTKHG